MHYLSSAFDVTIVFLSNADVCLSAGLRTDAPDGKSMLEVARLQTQYPRVKLVFLKGASQTNRKHPQGKEVLLRPER